MTTRSLKVRWSGGSVTAKLKAHGSATAVLLAHGAGAGQRHHFMTTVRDGVSSHGITVMTFDYAYTDAGRKAPDRMPRLLEVHLAALMRLAGYAERVVLVGKSMGGRVGSHLVGGIDGAPGSTGSEVCAMVYLAYPLVPIGKAEARPTDHLGRMSVPQLFVAGTRDRLSPPPVLRPIVEGLSGARLHIIDDADHGFHVSRRTGRTDEDVIEELVELIADLV